MRTTLLLALSLAGCSGPGGISDFASDIDTLRDVVLDHFDTMGAVGSLDAVATEESDYADAFEGGMTDMGMSMDTMMDCMGMMDGDDDEMDGMHEHMDTMETDRASHGDTQSTCSDMETCHDAESSHRDAMLEHLDAMESWMDDGGDGMGCGSDGMM